MGCYINPESKTKEEFLLEWVYTARTAPPVWDKVPNGMLPVCLVQNGYFTAAAVCYNENEMHAFSDPADLRPKTWFVVPINALASVSSVTDYLGR